MQRSKISVCPTKNTQNATEEFHLDLIFYMFSFLQVSIPIFITYCNYSANFVLKKWHMKTIILVLAKKHYIIYCNIH